MTNSSMETALRDWAPVTRSTIEKSTELAEAIGVNNANTSFSKGAAGLDQGGPTQT